MRERVGVMGKERMIDETMMRVFQSYKIMYVDACRSEVMFDVVACGMREIYTSSALFVDSES